MINLAGNHNCNKEIEAELRRAKIASVVINDTNGEVPASIGGVIHSKFGDITLTRAWRYWVAKGNIPLEIAKDLYADPVGVTDIRVTGHCGCPPPEDPWLEYEHESKEIVLDVDGSQEKEIKYFIQKGTIKKDCLDRVIFVSSKEERKEKAQKVFVKMYHIDTEIGLRVFSDTIRRYQSGVVK